MEWTPEALKAEIDYRQTALREDAAQYRVGRRSAAVKKSWWRLGHQDDRDAGESGNGLHRAA